MPEDRPPSGRPNPDDYDYMDDCGCSGCREYEDALRHYIDQAITGLQGEPAPIVESFSVTIDVGSLINRFDPVDSLQVASEIEEEENPALVDDPVLEGCDWCGQQKEDVVEIGNGGTMLCVECRSTAFVCEWCGYPDEQDNEVTRYPADSTRVYHVGECCYDEFHYCQSCSEYLTPSAEYWDGMCADCHQNDEWDDDYEDGSASCNIHSWNYRPPVILVNAKDALQPARYYLGMELETDDVSRADVAEAINDNFDYLYCKEDGSLGHGVEIVSHPGSLEAWQNGDLIDWTKWDRVANGNFPEMENQSRAGIHIHVSRTAFNRNGKWSASHLWKFMQLHYRNEKAFRLLAGRDGSTYAGWKALEDRKETVEKAKPARGYSGDRYRVINVNNEATVECRYFQADERKEVMLSHIELIHAAVEYSRVVDARSVRIGLLDFKYFRAWYMVRGKTYPNLVKRTRTFPDLIKENRVVQKSFQAIREAEKENERARQRQLNSLLQAMGITMSDYSGNNPMPPTYMSPISIRSYFTGRTAASRRYLGWVAFMTGGTMNQRFESATFIVRDLTRNYIVNNAQIDRYDVDVETWRTLVAWYAWDILMALKETTGLVDDFDNDPDRYVRFINRIVTRL